MTTKGNQTPIHGYTMGNACENIMLYETSNIIHYLILFTLDVWNRPVHKNRKYIRGCLGMDLGTWG